MIKIRLDNTDIVISNIKNSNRRWAFVLNDKNQVVYSKVIPPESPEYGAKLSIETMSDENLNRVTHTKYNENNKDLTQKIVELEDALGKNYGFGDKAQELTWHQMTFRTRAIKAQLGLFNDEEYSLDNVIVAPISIGKATLNYALRPVRIEYINEPDEEQKELNIAKSNGAVSIKKPTKPYEG